MPARVLAHMPTCGLQFVCWSADQARATGRTPRSTLRPVSHTTGAWRQRHHVHAARQCAAVRSATSD